MYSRDEGKRWTKMTYKRRDKFNALFNPSGRFDGYNGRSLCLGMYLEQLYLHTFGFYYLSLIF